MGKFTGKKAVVIGGTHGMGLAMVDGLRAGGGEVLLTGRNERNLEQARDRLGAGAHVMRSDITSMADIGDLADVIGQRFGRIDFLFVNAGVAAFEPFDQITEERFDHTFAVNTKGAFFTVQRLSPLIVDGGAIVFTTVTNGTGTPGLSVYAGSKAAVLAFAKVFAAELLPRRIRVNAVAPGFTDTPTLGVADSSEEERDALRAIGDAVTPMGRHGTAEEVAAAALFLASDATFTTGVEIGVDGGLAQVAPPSQGS